MNLRDLRRANLLLIIADVFGGRQVELAKRMQCSEAQLTQWKSPNTGIHERSARRIEAAAGKPAGWIDVQHESGHEGLVAREPGPVVPLYAPRPALRVALEVVCEELARVAEPERRESVGGLLKACAMAGGDAAYIDPLLALLRMRSAGKPNSQGAG